MFGNGLRGDLTQQRQYRLTPLEEIPRRLSEKGFAGRSPSMLSIIIICFLDFVNIKYTEMLYLAENFFGTFDHFAKINTDKKAILRL